MYVRDTATGLGRRVREEPEKARAELAQCLTRYNGNVRLTAQALACGRVTLYRWLATLGMDEAPELARAGKPLPWASQGPPVKRKSPAARR